jgi:cellulose synthase/poly-beta-1,6-N-acetylglucosamine synthase-like glycosyltransferase
MRRVTVVVPFYNRSADVEPCLAALAAQMVPRDLKWDVVAVDNKSTDGTLEKLLAEAERLAQRLDVHVIEAAERGPAAARNAGIHAAEGDWIALMDSDCRPAPDWLAQLVEPLAREEVLVTGGRIDALSEEHGAARYAQEAGILDQEFFLGGGTGFPPFLATANAAFRRETWNRAGGFNASLTVGEDADFCWRVLELGGQLVYRPTAVVRHRHRETFRGLYRWGLTYGEGTARLMALHAARLGSRVDIAWSYYPALASGPVRLLWAMLFEFDDYGRRRPLYDMVYRTGLLLGRWRGSLRHGVWCL